MKIHYKPTILDEIDKAIDKVAEEGRKIDHIELNEFEWFQLICEAPVCALTSAPGASQTSRRGVLIKRKKNEVSTKFSGYPWPYHLTCFAL